MWNEPVVLIAQITKATCILADKSLLLKEPVQKLEY